MDDLLKSPIRITDAEGLDTVSSLLHDETFDLDGVRFDRDAGVVTIPVRRQFHSGPERLIKKGLVFSTYEKEWMHGLVTIRGARSLETQKDQGINSYSFCSWRFTNGVIEVECNEALVLKLHVDSLDVGVADIGFRGKAHIGRGPAGIETSTSTIYE